jgi:hypothetical protein
MVGSADCQAIRWMDLACSGFQVLVQQQTTFRFPLLWGWCRLPDTLLGFEATGPLVLRPLPGETGTGGCLPVTGDWQESDVALLGGGVWCLICG